MPLCWHTLFGPSDINHGVFGVTMNQTYLINDSIWVIVTTWYVNIASVASVVV
jgi:hypothetical protein